MIYTIALAVGVKGGTAIAYSNNEIAVVNIRDVWTETDSSKNGTSDAVAVVLFDTVRVPENTALKNCQSIVITDVNSDVVFAEVVVVRYSITLGANADGAGEPCSREGDAIVKVVVASKLWLRFLVRVAIAVKFSCNLNDCV